MHRAMAHTIGSTKTAVALLLLTLDRRQVDELWMTQELNANMLGVRCEGVTEGALSLQQAGMIRYSRGHICVLVQGWRSAPASVMQWSRTNLIGGLRISKPCGLMPN
jgi:hypothetical protein